MSWTVRSIKLRTAILEGREPEWLKRHPRRDYVRQRIIATPPWPGVRAKVLAIYRMRQENETVDHIVPLNHPYVCGLHVPANLQRVPRACNAAKSNRWNPFQRELFKTSPQREMAL